MSFAERSFFDLRLATPAATLPGDGKAVTRIDIEQLLALRPAQ